MDIEQLRAAMAANVTKLAGKGNYLLLGAHELKIEKFFYKGPGEKTPLGLFIAEFKALKSSNPEMQIGDMTYSEGFDPAKSGWEHRLLKFTLASLGVDWRGKVPPEATQIAVDIRFSAQFESEREKMMKKYEGQAPEDLLIGRTVKAECTNYTTKKGVQIASAQWLPMPQVAA